MAVEAALLIVIISYAIICKLNLIVTQFFKYSMNFPSILSSFKSFWIEFTKLLNRLFYTELHRISISQSNVKELRFV